MSYQVLARKWRPSGFREMVGQEHVLRALINALDNERLHHAYLFTGTRGVGKTTIARILAKCLNCEAGVSSEPCGSCHSCTEIAEGRSVDLLEVDAASRTKVEDTRELLENEIGRFTIMERDGMIIACAALYPMDNNNQAELACVVTHPDYRRGQRAAQLLQHIEQQAVAMGIRSLFVLTTRTAHWFIEQGFVESAIDQLPQTRQSLYNYQRNSKIFSKSL